MNQTDATSQRADAIYRIGPETLIGRASAIYAGRLTKYTRTVESYSEGGADRIPLKWTVTGSLESPEVLKGPAPSGPVQISRTEQSPIVPRNPSTAHWEDVYGDLMANGQAVVFAGPESGSIVKVVPSGQDEQNMIALVQDVVRIQAIGDKSQRLDQWLVNVQGSSSDEGRKAALRSFVEEGGQWAPLEPVLQRALTDQRLSHPFRAFGFGMAAFGVSQEKWTGARDEVLRFLCEQFTAERDPRLAMQYTLSLGGLFSYADDENHRSERVAIRQSLERCVAQRPTLTAGSDAKADAGLEQQYRAFRARYLRNQ